MFCPECGTLGFMEPNGNIRCTNYTCGYEGPSTGKDGKGAEFTVSYDWRDYRFEQSQIFWRDDEESLKHLTEVVEDEGGKEVLRAGTLDAQGVTRTRFSSFSCKPRSSDEPETKVCTCKNCGEKFGEYQ